MVYVIKCVLVNIFISDFIYTVCFFKHQMNKIINTVKDKTCLRCPCKTLTQSHNVTPALVFILFVALHRHLVVTEYTHHHSSRSDWKVTITVGLFHTN